MDPSFVAENIDDNTPERKVLYEDPELGFCILAHYYRGAKESAPHDHGPSWAIYGQAVGETQMSDFELLEECFAPMEDPRLDRNKKHLLLDIMTITICAVISGADDWVAVAEFGQPRWIGSNSTWNYPMVSPLMIRLAMCLLDSARNSSKSDF